MDELIISKWKIKTLTKYSQTQACQWGYGEHRLHILKFNDDGDENDDDDDDDDYDFISKRLNS